MHFPFFFFIVYLCKLQILQVKICNAMICKSLEMHFLYTLGRLWPLIVPK